MRNGWLFTKHFCLICFANRLVQKSVGESRLRLQKNVNQKWKENTNTLSQMSWADRTQGMCLIPETLYEVLLKCMFAWSRVEVWPGWLGADIVLVFLRWRPHKVHQCAVGGYEMFYLPKTPLTASGMHINIYLYASLCVYFRMIRGKSCGGANNFFSCEESSWHWRTLSVYWWKKQSWYSLAILSIVMIWNIWLIHKQ